MSGKPFWVVECDHNPGLFLYRTDWPRWTNAQLYAAKFVSEGAAVSAIADCLDGKGRAVELRA